MPIKQASEQVIISKGDQIIHEDANDNYCNMQVCITRLLFILFSSMAGASKIEAFGAIKIGIRGH